MPDVNQGGNSRGLAEHEPEPLERGTSWTKTWTTSTAEPPSSMLTSWTKTSPITVPVEEPLAQNGTIIARKSAEHASGLIASPIESLLLDIAGPDPGHLELQPTGKIKCINHSEQPLTPDLIKAMLAGECSPGTTLKYPGGKTRALCLDADDPERARILLDAALKLDGAGASPLLESSPSVHHPGSLHLWLVFDGLVHAAAAYATVIEIVPELRDWPERWPEKGTRVRLPGAYYRRPGAEGWCQLWRPGGLHLSGERVFTLMLKAQTPASWVTASPPPAPEPVRRSTPARSTSSRWIPPTRPIQQSDQDTSLTGYAMKMADAFGMSEGAIYDELRRITDELCEQIPGDPILDSSLWAKARSAVKKARRLDA